jgi:hypothetical protein
MASMNFRIAAGSTWCSAGVPRGSDLAMTRA